MYKLTKKFTSRDGKLELDNRPYGITQEGLNEIGDAKPHLGGATHIFVKINGGSSNKAHFSTRDGQINLVREEKAETGWAEYGLEHGSAYNPDRGEVGWWSVRVDGAPSEVVEGIGLPYSWHVSHFLVFEWQEGGTVEPESEPEIPEENGPEIPGIKKYFAILYTDGTWVKIDA